MWLVWIILISAVGGWPIFGAVLTIGAVISCFMPELRPQGKQSSDQPAMITIATGLAILLFLVYGLVALVDWITEPKNWPF